MSTFLTQLSSGQWQALPLSALANHAAPPADETLSEVVAALHTAGVQFADFQHGSRSGVVLIAALPASDLYVNGEPVVGQVRVLGHKDELLLAGQRFFYSAEARPVVFAYQPAEGEHTPKCPICRDKFQAGQLVVRCPNPSCRKLFHELPGRNCWTINPTCKFCHHATALDGSGLWDPTYEEDEEAYVHT